MLRVLCDATALPANRGGVGRYVDELVARLPGLGVDTHVAAQPRDRDRFADTVGAEHVHVLPGWAERPALRLAWEQSGLPLLVRSLGPDVVHSPHYTLPLVSTIGRRPKNVVTLHDATFFSDPELHLGVKARFFRGWTSVSGRLADALIAPSEATRDEVARHTHTDAARIAVVPHGVDHDRFRPPTGAEVAERRQWLALAPDQPYVAFLGTLEPRKNVPALVRAFGRVAGELADPPVLVLAGGKGWDDAIEPAVAELPERLRVLRPGFVPDGLVPALLGGAEVVAYPAHGEGFGLPVLEAMACGAAVLTTDRLSLAEVGGDAVRYARSPDAADLAEALAGLLADPAERNRLGAAGLARSAGYTWDATARGHLAVFERVVRS
ncbi:MAG TPA: glycosyltransferase family 1 protein [Lapillicoccus sp.]|nr:glycosyltransferase family 1 protein [Lapillicoccus sp.]